MGHKKSPDFFRQRWKISVSGTGSFKRDRKSTFGKWQRRVGDERGFTYPFD
jgi:hypothetical protein